MESPNAVLQRYGLAAKKSWGQCFLHDPSIIERIAATADLSPEDIVVEIGAGVGNLTQALAARCQKVLAIERDRELAQVLRQEFAQLPQVEIHETNALTFDFAQLSRPVAVVGNLPYNISSPLIFHLLSHRLFITSATIMLQQEVALRIAAGPGSKVYGLPSVLCQQAAEVRYCFTVPSGAFFPRPRVDSAIIRLTMRPHPRVPVEEAYLQQVVRAAFNQRRKTLRRALRAQFAQPIIDLAFQRSGIDGRRRGEELSLEEFGQLTLGLFGGAEQIDRR